MLTNEDDVWYASDWAACLIGVHCSFFFFRKYLNVHVPASHMLLYCLVQQHAGCAVFSIHKNGQQDLQLCQLQDVNLHNGSSVSFIIAHALKELQHLQLGICTSLSVVQKDRPCPACDCRKKSEEQLLRQAC